MGPDLYADRTTASGRLQVLWPFMVCFGAAFALALVTRSSLEQPVLMVAAGGLVAATVASMLTGVWGRFSETATLVPVAAMCVAIDLMRAATGSGTGSGFGSLLLIPVVWQAMRRPQVVLVLTIVMVSIANIAAVLLLSSPLEAAAQWRSVVMFTVIAATIGETLHRLVADRSELTRRLTAQARLDVLTGLANRRGWEEQVPAAVARAKRTGEPLALVLFDLDRFKAYNDRFGHGAGDELLARAATEWNEALRVNDLLARWGGEEFVALLAGLDGAAVMEVMDRLQEATPEGQTFSAGFCVLRLSPLDDLDLDEAMRAADRAMYRAKAAGRGCAMQADLGAEPAEPVDAPLVVASP